MAIQYDSANNQVIFSGDAYVKRTAAGAVQVGNATTGPVFSDHALFTAITAPATPAAGKGRLYTAGASGSEELYWLNSGGSAKSLSAPTPPSGDTKVIYNDGGAWAAADVYYTKANGYLGVGQATPGERLHLKDGSGNGAVVLGAHQNGTAIAGTVEWTGTALRWYDGSVWKSAGIELTDPLLYKGAIDCSTNPNYPAADAGHTYRISVAGKIGGASGPNVEAGDMMICTTDSTPSGTHAAVGAYWDILQMNLDGAVLGPASATDSAVALFDLTTGKLIKNSLVTIDGSGSVNIPSGQSYKINGTALTAANVGAEPTLPLSTRGDLLYRNASNVTARLAVGTNEQVITTNGTDASWGAVPGRHDAVTLATSATTGGLGLSTQEISFQAASGSTNGYLTSTNWTTFNSKVSGAAGSNTEIQYNSSGAFAASSNLVWDNGNVRLGIGGAPQATLDVQATSAWIRAMGSTDPYVSAQDTTNSCVVKIQALDTAVSVGAQSDHEVRFIVNNAAKAYLTTTGMLGVGITPASVLATTYDGVNSCPMFIGHSSTDTEHVIKFYRSSGTGAVPAAVEADRRLGGVYMYGYYNGSSTALGAAIQARSVGLWSATNTGSFLNFFTTAQDTTTASERMRIMDTGKVGIMNTAPSAILSIGTAGTTAGSLSLAGGTSGTVTVQVAAVAGTGTVFQLPADNGTDGYFLKTNGSGVTSWTVPAVLGLTVPGSDHGTSGTTIAGTAGEGLAIGDVAYLKSDGKWWKADADAQATADGLLGMATAAISTDASGVFLLHGLYRDDTWNWTVGGRLYVGATPGNPTQTAPSTTGQIQRIVGYALTADVACFCPDTTFVELS